LRRLHLIEIEDQPWCPGPIRDAATDYLQFIIERAQPYLTVVPRLRAAFQRQGTRQVIDLGSGGGGPWLGLLPATLQGEDETLSVRLTDAYPNLATFQHIRTASGGWINYESTPVDATRVPGDLQGFRTLFTCFHHFRPDEAREILADAVRQRQGIAVFEATERRLPAILGMLLTPLIVLFVTPAIRPFRWPRIIWTYLVPLVPLVVLFDGIVSCLRTYAPEELRSMVRDLGETEYEWEIGREPIPHSPSGVTYLIGWPRGAGP
jgi:hypothetical protein